MNEPKYTHIIRIHQLTGYGLTEQDFTAHNIPRNIDICAVFVQSGSDDPGAFDIYPEGLNTRYDPWQIHPDDVTVVEVL